MNKIIYIRATLNTCTKQGALLVEVPPTVEYLVRPQKTTLLRKSTLEYHLLALIYKLWKRADRNPYWPWGVQANACSCPINLEALLTSVQSERRILADLVTQMSSTMRRIIK